MPPEEAPVAVSGPTGGPCNDVDGGGDSDDSQQSSQQHGGGGGGGGVLEGPDLNVSRSPYDKKDYRQILLPNGLRVVLVSDVVAMTQAYNSGGLYVDDDDEEDDGDEEDGNGDGDGKSNDDEDTPPGKKDAELQQGQDGPGSGGRGGAGDDGDSDDDEDEDDDGESEGAAGIRDAAAAMIVGVGSLYDPPECQGMAHFLEHLLFMGSRKYPKENAYDAFMTKHGGNDNAYTEMEHTVYHFDIPQEHLPRALDIFAQFFVHPLMMESSVDRELKAVESEFQLVKNSDNTRVQHLMCHTAGRTPHEHPGVKVSSRTLVMRRREHAPLHSVPFARADSECSNPAFC
jgi:nardilysin